jgi:hypothetical protein
MRRTILKERFWSEEAFSGEATPIVKPAKETNNKNKRNITA